MLTAQSGLFHHPVVNSIDNLNQFVKCVGLTPLPKTARKKILASKAFTIEKTTEHTIKCRPSPPADDFF